MSHLTSPHKSNICILLTATIDPQSMPFLKRNNLEDRENDYVYSIEKWLSLKTTYPIVFCENSGHSLKKIKCKIEEYDSINVEILQFGGQELSKGLGKGYGEMLIINHAIQNSKLIQKCEYVVKVTGRYFIKNIEKILATLADDNSVYVTANLEKNLTWADSRIFYFKPSFIENYLFKFQDKINDNKGFYLEHALSRAILCAISEGKKWKPLLYSPIIIGHSGTDNICIRQSRILIFCHRILHFTKYYLMQR